MRWRQPQLNQPIGPGCVADIRCGGLGEGVSGMDAVAALTDQPVEAFDGRVKSTDGRAIRGEGAQASPRRSDVTYLEGRERCEVCLLYTSDAADE